MKNAVETASLEIFKTSLNAPLTQPNHIFEQGFRLEVPTVPFNLNCPGLLALKNDIPDLHDTGQITLKPTQTHEFYFQPYCSSRSVQGLSLLPSSF